MPLFTIIILSLVQAVTEFLPISSSGHLVIMHGLMDQPGSDAWGNDLIMDLAVHVGTLLAVVVYYWRDVLDMLLGVFHWITRAPESKQDTRSRNLAFTLVISSIPVMAVGLVLTVWEPEWLRSVQVVAWTVLLFGLLLWWVDAKFPAEKNLYDLGWKGALLIGFAQCLALVPGTSRSGITMTAARAQGLTRPEAARFSFLLSIVATAAAGGMGALKLIKSGDLALAGDALVALVVTFIAALAVMAFLMRFLQRYTFKSFGIYRVVLGVILLVAVYGYGWK
jgi:undecaprenyl-diphosphatase